MNDEKSRKVDQLGPPLLDLSAEFDLMRQYENERKVWEKNAEIISKTHKLMADVLHLLT